MTRSTLTASVDGRGIGSLRPEGSVPDMDKAGVSSRSSGSAMKIIDLFCCQGGASAGYAAAGFEPFGVDIDPQPRYPFAFHQGDALAVMEALIVGEKVAFIYPSGEVVHLGLSDFSAAHASPPCQAYTLAQRIRNRPHPDLVGPTRDVLVASKLPWIIENVEGAPLYEPILLCGSMFPGLRVYRHRLFESDHPFHTPIHPSHVAPLRKMGRPPADGDFMHVVGNFSGVETAKAAMGGVDWMNRDGLRESIPPAFTEYLGRQMMAHISLRAAA